MAHSLSSSFLPRMISRSTALRTLSLLVMLSSIQQAIAGECTVEYSGDGVTDDSPAILKAFTECAVDSVITFAPANYSAYTPITLNNLSTSYFCAASTYSPIMIPRRERYGSFER